MSGVRRTSIGAACMAAALAFAACSDDESRAARADCSGGGCGGPGLIGGGGSTASDGGASDGGAVTDGAASTTLSGSVAVFADEQFVGVTSYAGGGTIDGPAPDGTRVSAQLSGGIPFSLPGVAARSNAWIGLRDSGFELMTSLWPVDTTAAGDVELAFVQRATMELIVSTLSNPVELDQDDGHVVLQFFNSSGSPLSGVRMTQIASADLVAYDDSGGYSDVLDETGADGRVVLFNVPALSYPGGSVTLGFEYAGVAYVSEARVADDAVTLSFLVVEP